MRFAYAWDRHELASLGRTERLPLTAGVTLVVLSNDYKIDFDKNRKQKLLLIPTNLTSMSCFLFLITFYTYFELGVSNY